MEITKTHARLSFDCDFSTFGAFHARLDDRDSGFVVFACSANKATDVLAVVGTEAGLYVLQAEDSTLYVGQSRGLKTRLQNHPATKRMAIARIAVFVDGSRVNRLAGHLHYLEAKLYTLLQDNGFGMDQSDLRKICQKEREKLIHSNPDELACLDRDLNRFLGYLLVIGLNRPNIPKSSVPGLELTPNQSQTVAAEEPQVAEPLAADAAPPSPVTSLAKLRVQLATGEAILGKRDTDVFVRALETVGLHRVSGLNLTLGGVPLVAQQRQEKYKYGARPSGDLFIAVHSDTAAKANLLKKISDRLGLKWVVSVTS